jgi:hypothetical protein
VSANNQNQAPQKRVIKVEKFQTSSGQLVKLRWTEISVFKNNQLTKEEYLEVVPPLTDNRIPDSAADCRECCVCLQAYHKDSVFECPLCGKSTCKSPKCRDVITVEGKGEIVVCAACADEAKAGSVKKLWRELWKLGD